ncbi:MAG: NAD-dependent epimerase/dehydratase family protein [Chloroflexi bacterium]|nr:NAD-dependent epimerase/dehydratase family protein [Chloroflexota bacterium]
MSTVMRHIAITGISGYVGTGLLKRLSAHPDVETIIGVDTKPTMTESSKLRFYLRDVTEPLDEIMIRERIDTAVHLAFVMNPNRNDTHTRRVNVQGSRRFISACREAGVEHLLYFGSTAAYGAHPDNPVPLKEDSPLRPNAGFQYSRDKASTDHLFQEYAVSNPDISVTILRGAPVLGPRGTQAIGAKVFQRVMVQVNGLDPAVQYMHEDDLMDVLVLMLEKKAGGVYNVAGDGFIHYSDVARMARRPLMPLPKGVLGGLMNMTWALRIQSHSTAAGLDFIAYPWVGSNKKLKRETGFEYRYSAEDTVDQYLRAIGRR